MVSPFFAFKAFGFKSKITYIKKKVMKFLTFPAVCLILASCSKQEPTNQSQDKPIDTTTAPLSSAAQNAKISESSLDSVLVSLDKNRKTIEAKLHDLDRVEVGSEYLRAKVKQKWSKIHIYTQNGQIQRIKTYPHAMISTRTEEFYFLEGRLAMVVLENDGEWTQTQDSEKLDKVFYFQNGTLIHETGSESPYQSIENMSVELIQEAVEYATLYKEALERKK